MCKYCENLKNSDGCGPVSLGVSGVGKVNLDRKDEPVRIEMEMESFEDGNTGLYGIYATLLAGNFQIGEPAVFHINYCPVCGRKLAERTTGGNN